MSIKRQIELAEEALRNIPDWIKGDGAMGKRLSDDPGLAEMKRMEYLMSKAPCIKPHVNPPMRVEGFPDVNALADWSEKKTEDNFIPVKDDADESAYRRPVTRGEVDL